MLELIFSRVNLILCASAVMLTSCSGPSTVGTKPGESTTIATKDLALSVTGYVPVFANTQTTTGMYVYNVTGAQVSTITAEDTVAASSLSNRSKLLGLVKSISPQLAGIFSSNLTATSGFTLDPTSVSSCINDLNRGIATQCLLNFTTPLVRDSTENGSAVVTLTTTTGKKYSQLVSWDSIPKSSSVPASSFFGRMPSSINSSSYATVYLYVGAEQNISPAPMLTVGITPAGSAYIDPVYTSGTLQVPTTGKIIPIQIKPSVTNFSQASSIDIKDIQDISLFSYLTLANNTTTPRSTAGLTIIPNNSANITASNIPTIFTESNGNESVRSKVTILNTGFVPATGFVIDKTGPISIKNNTCGTTLAVGARCSYVVETNDINSPTILSNVSYSFVSRVGGPVTTQKTDFYVINNTAGDTGAFLTFTTPPSQLLPIGNESITFSIGVQSLSTSRESAILDIESYITGSAIVSKITNNCPIGLPPGGSCIVLVTIKSALSSTIGGVAGAKINYTTRQRVTPIYNTITTPYSILSYSYLTISPVSPYYMSVSSAINTPLKQQVKVINSGNISAIIKTFAASPTLPTTYMSIESNTCAIGLVLSANESCGFIMSLRSNGVSPVTESGNIEVNITYANSSTPTVVVGNPIQAIFNWTVLKTNIDTELAIIKVESIPAQNSGIGASGNPIVFTGANATANKQQIKITYKNISSLYSIESLLINSSSLPSVYSIDSSSTCGYVESTGVKHKSIMAPNYSCFLILNIDRTSIPFLANSAGLADISFAYPNASWGVLSRATFTQENFIYNNASSLSVSYTMAVLSTALSANNSNWESSNVTQQLTNATGYGAITATSTYHDQFDPLVMGITNLSSCTVSPPNLIQCGNISTSSWTMQIGAGIASNALYFNTMDITVNNMSNPVKIDPQTIYIVRSGI